MPISTSYHNRDNINKYHNNYDFQKLKTDFHPRVHRP